MEHKHIILFDKLEEMHDSILAIEEELENAGFDLDEILKDDEEIEEGFEGSSRMQRLIAQRKAAMRRRLKTGGTKYNSKKK